MDIRRKYTQQRYRAQERGIEWKLTYLEWLKWWHDSGHWHERGCRRGQYVMARIDDTGPYAIGNIVCILCTENFVHGPINNRGERNPRAKLTWEQVWTIRLSTLSRRELAEQYDVSPYTIKAIRATGRNWKEKLGC